MSTVDKAAQIAHNAAFANAGQCCVAATRTYVQSGIYDKFVAKAAEIAKNRTVGNPFEDVIQGPQVRLVKSITSELIIKKSYNLLTVQQD